MGVKQQSLTQSLVYCSLCSILPECDISTVSPIDILGHALNMASNNYAFALYLHFF